MKRSGIPKPRWVHTYLGPSARALRLRRDLAWYRLQANRPGSANPAADIAFIVGCGRSGTTILGDLLAAHPKVSYLYEPNDRWSAVDSRTDITGLFTTGAEARAHMSAADSTDDLRRRFDNVFRRPARFRGRLLVEKTPINAMRMGYLDALAPDARFVILQRDARRVIRSIVEFAERDDDTRIAGKPDINPWWGADGVKWKVLRREVTTMGLLPAEALEDASFATMAACEWLATSAALHGWVAALGQRVLIASYEGLSAQPVTVLKRIADFLELPGSEEWLNRVKDQVHPDRGAPLDLELPDPVRSAVNHWQQRQGFEPL